MPDSVTEDVLDDALRWLRHAQAEVRITEEPELRMRLALVRIRSRTGEICSSSRFLHDEEYSRENLAHLLWLLYQEVSDLAYEVDAKEVSRG